MGFLIIPFLNSKSAEGNWGTVSCMSVSNFCGSWQQRELLLASMPNSASVTLAWSSMIQPFHCFIDFNAIVLITLIGDGACFLCLPFF